MWAGPRGPGLLSSQRPQSAWGPRSPGRARHTDPALPPAPAAVSFHIHKVPSMQASPPKLSTSFWNFPILLLGVLLLLSSPQLRLPGVWGPASPQLLAPQATSSAHKGPLLLKFRFRLHA